MNNFIKPPMLSTHFNGSKKGIKQRIANILDESKKRKGIIALFVIIAIIATVGIFVGCGNVIEQLQTPDPSIGSKIENYLDIITSSPAISSAPGDYIAAHRTEYDAIIDFGDDALIYMGSRFEQGSRTDLRGHIMALACGQILGGNNISYAFETGQDWYDTYKNHIENIINLNSLEFVEETNPKGLLLIGKSRVRAGELATTPRIQIQEYLDNIFTQEYTQYYDNLKFEISNYSYKIDGDNFTATFLYTMKHTNYYKDPDTVEYIIQAKESGSPSYQALYDDYNAEHEGNHDFQATAKTLPDGSIDISTIEVLGNGSPRGKDYYVPFMEYFPSSYPRGDE